MSLKRATVRIFGTHFRVPCERGQSLPPRRCQLQSARHSLPRIVAHSEISKTLTAGRSGAIPVWVVWVVRVPACGSGMQHGAIAEGDTHIIDFDAAALSGTDLDPFGLRETNLRYVRVLRAFENVLRKCTASSN